MLEPVHDCLDQARFNGFFCQIRLLQRFRASKLRWIIHKLSKLLMRTQGALGRLVQNQCGLLHVCTRCFSIEPLYSYKHA